VGLKRIPERFFRAKWGNQFIDGRFNSLSCPNRKFKLHGPRHHPTQFINQGGFQAALQPIASVGIAGAQIKNAGSFIEPDQLRLLHPGIVSCL